MGRRERTQRESEARRVVYGWERRRIGSVNGGGDISERGAELRREK